MAFNDAHAFTFSLATILLVAIIIFRAGVDTHSVISAAEFAGDAEIIGDQLGISLLLKPETYPKSHPQRATQF